MSSNISSNTLFHFTDSAEKLINILTEEFKPKYCLEDYVLFGNVNNMPDSEREFATPMVCFCDLPLSQVGSHLQFYGSYGLGMRKEWGKKQGLSPVIYVTYESTSMAYYLKLYDFLISLDASINQVKEDTKGMLRSMIRDSLEFTFFFKPYEGRMWRRNEYVERRFYDEREWRFIPSLEKMGCSMHDGEYRLSREEYLNSVYKAQADANVGNKAKLKFEPDDIKYIIVAKEKEINAIISAIEQIKSPYDEKTKKLLASRVISTEQILEDF